MWRQRIPNDEVAVLFDLESSGQLKVVLPAAAFEDFKKSLDPKTQQLAGGGQLKKRP
jgi:hypothetical protein